MEDKNYSILVIGAGAIGGITAALLRKNGHNVEILCRQEEYAKLISDKGIEISGVCGKFSIRIPAYSSIKDINGRKDFILHATKATELPESAAVAMTVLKESGYIVSMQNGICEDALAEIVGKDKVIGCVTGWGATMEAQGKFTMTSTGDFIIGYPQKLADEKLNDLAKILSSVVPAKVTDNIYGHLYSKLIVNACITSLGAICGLYLGKMLAIKKVRKIFIEIIRESVLVAESMGINIEVFGGKLDFKSFSRKHGLLNDFRNHLVILIIGFKYRRLKSSSLQSLERGKKTEVEYFNGYITLNAKKYNLKVPVNESVVRIIHEIESGIRRIAIDNFNDPAFDSFND